MEHVVKLVRSESAHKLVDELDNVIKFEAEYKGALKDALDDLCKREVVL